MNQNDQLKAASEAAVLRIVEQDAAGKEAAAAILPGPLKQAFALNQGINVGGWTVRPFSDIDFEFLATLEHPLSQMYRDALRGDETKATFLPSGPTIWQAAWILTRDIDTVEMLLSQSNGKEQLAKAARSEFGRLPPRILGEFFKAVMKQIEVSSSTTVKYEAAAADGEAAKAKTNPSSQPLQRTG